MIDITGLREDKRPQSSTIVHALLDRLEAAEKERDALRAKIEQMERQEPFYLFRRKGLDDFCTCSKERYEAVSANPRLFEVKKLYALPGAQPKLDEIRTALQRALELGQRETWTGARKHRSHEDQREEQQCWNKVWSLLDAKGEEK